MKKQYNYYGMKTGDLCFIDEGRKEKGVFKIFSDGSYSIIILKNNDEKYSCLFGGIDHVKYLIKKGYFTTNKIISEKFKKALITAGADF